MSFAACRALTALRATTPVAPLARSLFVKATANSGLALEKLQAKMSREGMERLLMERQRYLKPKYARQKNKAEAIYKTTKRLRVKLVEQFLKDTHIQPF